MASLYRRDTQRPDGSIRKSYCVEFKDPVKGRKIKQFKLRKDASRFLQSLNSRLAEHKPLLSYTSEEVIEKWLESCKIGRDGRFPLEQETIRTYRGLSNNHIIPYFRGQSWDDISKDDCKAFRDHLIATTNSRSTAKSILTVFKACMSFSIEEGIIATNPATGITIVTGGRQKQNKVIIPSKSEIRTLTQNALSLVETLPRSWIKYCPMLHLFIYCGLRSSEVLGLPRSNINIKNRSVEITQRTDKEGKIGPPKSSASYRTLYFPDSMAEMLEKQMKSHNHDLVFSTSKGTPILHRNLHRHMWRSIQKRSELPSYYTLHSLRHFYASIMIARGCNLKELCKSMGHHDEGFTLRTYGHLFEDEESIRHRKQMANAIVI